MKNIETRWHKLADSARDLRIRLAAIDELEQSRFASADLVDPLRLQNVLAEASRLPRLVISQTALQLVSTDQAMLSVSDMLTCGVLHLPFERCVVEYDHNETSYNILLEERTGAGTATQWILSAFAYRGARLNDDAVLVFPCRIRLEVHQSVQEMQDSEAEPPELPDIQYGVESEPFIGKNAQNALFMTDIAPLLLDRCMTAFLAAVILPRTVGLRQEERSVKPTFNKGREAKGRSPIPNYTFVNVGDFGGIERKVAGSGDRGPISVHLRRAHKKRIVFGEGRSQRVWRFIPPQVVGYLPDSRKPTMPEMLASRALKPYVLR